MFVVLSSQVSASLETREVCQHGCGPTSCKSESTQTKADSVLIHEHRTRHQQPGGK